MTSQQLTQVGTTLRCVFRNSRRLDKRRSGDLEKRGHGNWPHPEPKNG